MKMLVLLLAIVLAVGCRTAQSKVVELAPMVPDVSAPVPPVVTVHADTDFSDVDKKAIADACHIWSVQTDRLTKITVVYDLDFNDMASVQSVAKDVYIVSLESWMPAVRAMDGDGIVLGWMGPAGGIHNPWGIKPHGAFVADRLNSKNRLQVFVHEFGHLLGIPHLPNIQATMFPNIIVGRKACLHKPDLDAFCSVNECGTHTMYPCE